MLRKIIFLLFVVVPFLSGLGQEKVWMHPNKGQWDARILYKVSLGQGEFYIENDRFTYALNNLSEMNDHGHDHDEHPIDKIKTHTVHSVFENSSWEGQYVEEKASSFYRNYFLGSDSSKWVSEIHSVQYVRLIEFYEGIDLVIETDQGLIKYSFAAKPGADVSQIVINHQGADRVVSDGREVELHTRFGPVRERNLNVWNQSESGAVIPVRALFKVEGNRVYFDLPDGYDTTQALIIDPEITFSTFTGATSDNWGFTAAPDNNANLFAGGIVFGSGYPITTGAYDASFNGGQGMFSIDIALTKFNTTGTALLYSTFVGGIGNETPNSIVTNSLDELYVLGVSSSTNFPVTAGAFQTIFGGGPSTTQNALQFNGTDIVIFRLNAAGTNLLSSTYMGGNDIDGLNLSTPLKYNYGDQFRGEIITDENDEVFIVSSTRSANFPIVNGFDATLGGTQDGVVAKFSANLNTLYWSTFIGGSQDDSGYALQTNSSGEIYVAGGTNSSDMPLSNGNATGLIGGQSDGYIIRLNGNSSNPINGTYVGTSQYDQNYFVQLDLDDNVYVFGQSRGNMSISPGVYNNPNSGQFIRKYNTNLNSILWTTVVGGGNGVIEISPTAFLVSDCYEIYYAGWGGQTNQSSQATSSTSSGFPVTPDAFEPNTSGNNFYIAVLDENATNLNYATYMGGVNSSANHVDGGTSRFDKKGRIYHAVCGACGGNDNGFTTTPGVYSPVNQSSNCNLAAFKFDLGIIESTISAPEPFVCIPDSVYFVNNSQNGNEYFWDFGDGTTSTDFEPVHYYNQPGNYDVLLVVSDTAGCYEADSSYFSITIGLFEGAVVDPPDPICPGDSYQLEATGGAVYAWSPAQFLDDSTLAMPTATVFQTTVFTVIVSDSCGIDTLTTTLEVFGGNANYSDDLVICLGDTVELWATGGASYLWSDASNILGPPDQDTIVISPQTDTEYNVTITTAEGCEIFGNVFVEVFQAVPQPVIEDTIPLCLGESVSVTVSGAPSYEWFPNQDIMPNTGPTVLISTPVDRWYLVDFSNACGTVRDSVFIDVIEVNAMAGNDTIVCPKEPVNLWATGGVAYSWTPANSISNPFLDSVVAQPIYATTYTVLVTDEHGCQATAQVIVDHFPLPYVQTSPDYYGFQGDEVQLGANGSSPLGTYSWSPTEYLSCVNCQNPVSVIPTSMTYTVAFEDENGCKAEDDVTIFFEGIIYVPNTFTPDNNGFNDFFFPKGGNIDEFEMLIFNRWGEVIFESNDFHKKWDGTYKGEPVKDGTYVWKIIYSDFHGNKEEITGHVNVLR
ncbi:MAG: gliding motility-associated C-terminal domain-containing protein [Brumimicrobium sp.]|nr:gliding motility-associated C-terminal domain-containing protein [Brumimicrobium sp.]